MAYIPVHFVQKLIIKLIDKLFQNDVRFSAEGILTYGSQNIEILHNVLCAFVGFSLIQICLRWLVLYVGTHKNKNFNYLFDGIVYSVFLSLGYALAENVHFAIQNDADMILAKALTLANYQSLTLLVEIGIILSKNILLRGLI